ncbi:hypothetical protein U8335_27245 [Roseiconus lacunae]|uniref:hypothetical protein n=1 Tax=Roseiconus lacunae TaxID=2605694 RepID=UPI003092A6E9|nr:hypothetical protein U8335_27245 [Stieleria sp. HD01]
MRFSIADVLALPLIGLGAIHFLMAAEFIAFWCFPSFERVHRTMEDRLEAWGFLDQFVFGTYACFQHDFQTILITSAYVAILFAFRTRICDHVAILTLALLPIVSWFQFGWIFTNENDGLPSRLIGMLLAQWFTAFFVGAIITAYVYSKQRVPNATPTRHRTGYAAIFLAAIFVSSVAITHALA